MDDTTFFDQRPPHPIRPAWIIRQQTAVNLAWSEYHAEIDRQLNSVQWDREKLNALRRVAVEEEAKYYYYCDAHDRGQIPPDVKAAMEAEVLEKNLPSILDTLAAEYPIPFDRASDAIPAEQREDARRDNV